jgi:hypothetical protein
MSERKLGMAFLVILGLFWWMAPAKHDPTQCDIPTDSSELIEELATVKESLTVQPDHIPEATKMIDPQPSPSDKPHEKIKRKILVFLAPKDQKCEPCDRWKRCEMQRFMDADWDVAIFDGAHSYGRTPTFEIESGDTKVTRTGYTTLEQAAEAVR